MAIKIQERCPVKKIIWGKRKRKSTLTLIKNQTGRPLVKIEAKKGNSVIKQQ